MIRFVDLPRPSSGIPYVNTDFTSVLQDEHLKSYASILDGINSGSTFSTESRNSGIILKGCDILSANGSQFQMGFTNSVVYINGEFYEVSPTVTGTITLNDPFYIFAGPTVSEVRTLPIDQLTTTTFSHTRYFTYSTTLPTVPHIKFSNRGTSRYYKRILKYFTSRQGDIYMTKSLNNFDINGVGLNDMAGFVILDSNSGVSGLPNLGGRFLKGWNTNLSLNNIQPGSLGGSHSHAITLNELGNHKHNTSEAKFATNWNRPFTSEFNTLSSASRLNPDNISSGEFEVINRGSDPFTGDVISNGSMKSIRWDSEDYDPNGWFDTTSCKYSFSGVGSPLTDLTTRFRISLTIRLNGSSGLGVWSDAVGKNDELVIWVIRSKNPAGFNSLGSGLFNKNMILLNFDQCNHIPFRDENGQLTPTLPYLGSTLGYPGLKLRPFIDGANVDSPGSVSQNGNPGWSGSFKDGAWEYTGDLTTEYFTAKVGEEYLFFLGRFPKNALGTTKTEIKTAFFSAEFDPAQYNYNYADFYHYHRINTGRFVQDTYEQNIPTPLSLGKDPQNPSQWVSPDNPSPSNPLTADLTTGSIFGKIEAGDFGDSSPYFTGGVHNRPNSELQNHTHGISQIDFGDGIVGNLGTPHENRPPYFVTVYYTKKSN